MMNSRRLATAVAVALATPAAAVAQQETQYSDEQIGAFADALGAAALVAEAWRPRIEAAQSASEAQELTRQSQDEMIAAIEGSGITLGTYNEIYLGAQSDPELAARVNTALQERYGQ